MEPLLYRGDQVGRPFSQRMQLAAPRMQRVGGGLQETGPEHPGSPTLSLQAHRLQQLSVTSPQEASSPFTSNQVLGNVVGSLSWRRGVRGGKS